MNLIDYKYSLKVYNQVVMEYSGQDYVINRCYEVLCEVVYKVIHDCGVGYSAIICSLFWLQDKSEKLVHFFCNIL